MIDLGLYSHRIVHEIQIKNEYNDEIPRWGEPCMPEIQTVKFPSFIDLPMTPEKFPNVVNKGVRKPNLKQYIRFGLTFPSTLYVSSVPLHYS